MKNENLEIILDELVSKFQNLEQQFDKLNTRLDELQLPIPENPNNQATFETLTRQMTINNQDIRIVYHKIEEVKAFQELIFQRDNYNSKKNEEYETWHQLAVIAMEYTNLHKIIFDNFIRNENLLKRLETHFGIAGKWNSNWPIKINISCVGKNDAKGMRLLRAILILSSVAILLFLVLVMLLIEK